MRKLSVVSLVLASTGSWSSLAWSAEADVGETSSSVESSEEAPATTETEAPKQEEEAAPATGDADGARFRWGISGGAGLMAINDSFGNSLSGFTGTFDLRFGAQINDLIGVYAQPQLGGYSLGGGGGGIVGVTGLIDFTLADNFFLAGGLGWGMLNNPSGLELHFRGGMYPILGGGEVEARRKALMLGVDFRVFLVDGATGISPTLSIGYESF